MNRPWQIPATWEWTLISEVAAIVGGGTPRTNEPSNWQEGEIPWITPADLSGYNTTRISRGSRNITAKGLNSSGARLLPTGSVLFSSRAPIGYVAIAANPLATNQGFKSFVAHQEVLPDYVYYFLKRARELAIAIASGTTFLEISGAKAALIPFPISPVTEQQRVVQEIEKQFTRLDAAVEALKRAHAKLKRYRASVLKAACEGRLVHTDAELARADGRNYEPADVLVQRVLKERRAAWEERELTRTARARPASKRTETRSKYREAASLSMDDLPVLPDGWLWVTIEALLSEPMCNGISVKGSNNPPGVPALKLNAMTDRGFLYAAMRYIPISKATAEDLRIVAGDFFVARGNGSLALVGRGTRAQEPPFEVVFPDTMIRLRFVPSASSTNWVPTIWPSALVRRQIQSKIKTTAGIWKIAQPQVASIVVPLPPLAEQHRIVAEVDRRLSVIDELEASVGATLKRAERLRQSILKRAFEGKLVPQNPNDEPASVFLERIRAERKPTGEGAASHEGGNKTQRKRA